MMEELMISIGTMSSSKSSELDNIQDEASEMDTLTEYLLYVSNKVYNGD